MAQFHFVEDYERHVSDLLTQYPLDEAMSLAVGGSYEHIGQVERSVLKHSGLVDGMFLVDLGCGSGRLAHALGRELQISYLGIDIVQPLLDYAATKAPAHYRFIMHRELTLPVASDTADMICAFSLFTHLLHTESFIYLEEMHRALKHGGLAVFSFLEFAAPEHWDVFAATVASQRNDMAPHLNMFIERTVIDTWCSHIDFHREAFIDAADKIWDGHNLGQSIAILRKA